MTCVLFVALLALAVFTTTVLADTKEEITADNSEVDHNVLKLNHDDENKKYERVARSDNNQDVRFRGRRRFEGGRRFEGRRRSGGGIGTLVGGGRLFGGRRRYHGDNYGGRGGYGGHKGYGGHGSARYDGDHGSAHYGGQGQFPYGRGHGRYPHQRKVPYGSNNNNGWRNQ